MNAREYQSWCGIVQQWAVEVAMQEFGSPYMAPEVIESANKLLRVHK